MTYASNTDLTSISLYGGTPAGPAGPATIRVAVYSVNAGVATLVPGTGTTIVYTYGSGSYSWHFSTLAAALPAGVYLLVFQQYSSGGASTGFNLGQEPVANGGDVYTTTSSSDITGAFSPWTLPAPVASTYGVCSLQTCP